MTPFMYFMNMWIENNDVTEQDILVIMDMVAAAKLEHLLWEQILATAESKVRKAKESDQCHITEISKNETS